MKREFDEFDKKIENAFNSNLEVPENVQEIVKNALNDVTRKSNKRHLLNMVAVLLVVCLVGMLIPQAYAKIKWNIEYKEFENREISYGYSSVRDAMDSGYSENVDMEYIYKDGVGLKISKIMISDNDFSAKVNLYIDESIPVSTENILQYGYAIYDENNNVYEVFEPIEIANPKKELTYFRKLYKELGIEYDKNNIATVQLADSSTSGGIKSVTGRELTTEINLTSTKGFPKSKKLYIRIFDIFNNLVELGKDENGRSIVLAAEKLQISDNEWIIEIDVPEKFNKRENIELKLAEDVTGVNLLKAIITDTKMSVTIGENDKLLEIITIGKDQDFTEFRKNVDDNFHIEDESGTVYSAFDADTFGTNSYKGVDGNFNINKNNMPEKLYLVINNGEGVQKIELIQK